MSERLALVALAAAELLAAAWLLAAILRAVL